MECVWIVCDSNTDISSSSWFFSSKEAAMQAINNWINNVFSKFEDNYVNYYSSTHKDIKTEYFNFSWLQNGELKEFEVKLFPVFCNIEGFPEDWETLV